MVSIMIAGIIEGESEIEKKRPIWKFFQQSRK
jgi:hypothetical protein